MTRDAAFVRLIWLTGAVLLFSVIGVTAVSGQDRPNILWITCEDMSPTIGCYGDTYAHTPVLDALAEESLVFDNAYANSPVCSPARSALFFGIYQGTLGIGNHRGKYDTPSKLRGFPAFIRDAGYFVTNHTKTDYNTTAERPLVRDAFDDGESWRDRPSDKTPFFSILNLEVTHASRTTVWPRDEFDRRVASRIAPELRRDPDLAPVPPYLADTPAVRDDIARAYDCVTVMDRQVGEILTKLEHDGLDDDTIVFFFSDHGSGFPRHKSTALGTGLRVPLLVRVPVRWRRALGVAGPGRITTPVDFLDLAATAVELANAARGVHLHGASIFEFNANQARTVVAARDRIDERFDAQRTVTDGIYLYLRNFMPHVPHYQPHKYQEHAVARVETYRLVRSGELGGLPAELLGPRRPEELYELATDPMHLENLAEDPAHAAMLTRLRQDLRSRLLEWRDMNLVPEAELVRLSAEHKITHFELGQRDDLVPLADVHAAAWAVGGGTPSLSRHLADAAHSSPSVRYWAAIGLHQQNVELERVRIALGRLAHDPSPIVRAAAGWALLDRGDNIAGARAIRSVLDDDDRVASEFAARAVLLLERKAADLQDDVIRAAERIDSGRMKRSASMFVAEPDR